MNTNISFEYVDVGMEKIKIPVARIGGKSHGPSILITAGMDGDEYPAIDAAYKIIELYQTRQFSGLLTILPIVNIAGFEAGMSKNPLDGKFPKRLFPGNSNGSPSERLIWWMSNHYLSDVSVWIDLHGGSVYERLIPVTLMYETKNNLVNERNIEIIHSLPDDLITYESEGAWGGKPNRIGERGVSYVLSESGDLGNRDEIWVKKHLARVEAIMGFLGMIQKKPIKKIKTVYRKIQEEYASRNGLWYPQRTNTYQKDAFLGEIRTYEGKVIRKINAKKDGIFLWGLEGTYCKKGDCLVAYGCNPERI